MEVENIKVRLATQDDAEQLALLNQKFNGGEIRALQDVSESLVRSSELVAIAYMDDEAAGFACAQSFASFCYQELQGEITELYVRGSARRKGVAASLIALLEEELQARGVRTVKVLTGETNEAGQGIYEYCQYERQDEIVFHKEIGEED